MLQVIGFVVVVAFIIWFILHFLGVSLWTLVGALAVIALAVYIYTKVKENRNVL